MSFEITFLGTSGGPLETGTCLLLVKPALLSYAQALSQALAPLFLVDAGLGWSALARVIRAENSAANGCATASNSLIFATKVSKSLAAPQTAAHTATHPFSGLLGDPQLLLREVFSRVAAHLISHPHLDHVQLLVLNLPGAARFLRPVDVFASKFTTDALGTHVFNGVVWPDLVSLGIINLNPVTHLEPFVIANDAYTVTRFDVIHGHVVQEGLILPYLLLAFLVCDNTSGAKLLVFGDFEADSVLATAKNAAVWRHVAPFVVDGSLKCIVLECSTHSMAPNTNLYGHMTPHHVFAELKHLNSLCVADKAEPLKNLLIFVTHVKDTFDGVDPRIKVREELLLLNLLLGLGVAITVMLDGTLVVA